MEFDLIDMIRNRTECARPDVVCGIGDDAALLRVPDGHELAVSVDTLVEGVHFLSGSAPRDLGWKSLAVNLSDLAAMGAEPAWALLALTLPRADRAFVEEFIDGFAQLAGLHGLALVGGDTTQGPLTISVTVHGFVPIGQALVRSGAQVGDRLLVSGPLGDAAAALQCLDESSASARAMRRKLERPEPRVAAGIALRGRVHAAIDISDGLLSDVGHVCRASGVGVCIEACALPRSQALLSRFSDAQARDFALAGGDAYELCLAVSPDQETAVIESLRQNGCQPACVGQFTAGDAVRVRDEHGADITAGNRGWEHFRT